MLLVLLSSPVFAGYIDLCKLITHKGFKTTFIPDTSKNEQVFSLSAGTLHQKGLFNLSSIPGLLKVYIPAGTIYGYVNIYLPINNKTGYVVRYNHAPECKYYYNDYANIPWDTPNQVHLVDIEQHDVYLRNWGGITAALSPFSLSTPLNKGGWLYIRRLSLLGTSEVHKITASFKVNTTIYKEWYDNGIIFSGNVPVITPTKPTNYTPPINNTDEPVIVDHSGALSVIFGTSTIKPDSAFSSESYSINISGATIKVEFGKSAIITNDNVQFTLDYKRIDNRIEIYNDDGKVILELVKYKGGLLVVPAKKLVLNPIM